MPLARCVVTLSNPILGGTGTNTWHVRVLEPGVDVQGSIEELMDIVRIFYADVATTLAGGTMVTWNGEAAGVGEDEGSYWASDPWSVPGNAAGNPLPPANCVCVNWRGESGDRSRRGRTFLGPIDADVAESNGTIAATPLAQIRTAASTLVSSSLADTNGAIGVWSRQESVMRDFSASSVRDQFAVLRSRRD